MSRAPREWDLPGPSNFVRSVVASATAGGTAVVVAPPHCPPGLEIAIEDACGHFEMPIVRADEDRPALASLSAAFDIEARSAVSMPGEALIEGRIVVVNGLNFASWPRWDATLRAWSAGCARRSRYGAALIAVVSPECLEAVKKAGLRDFQWAGVVNSRDAMLWALNNVPSDMDPLLGRLAVETAVALAGWDLSDVKLLIEKFVSDPRRIFDIPSTTAAGGARDALWKDGEADWADGHSFVRLQRCGREELVRRVWRAQTTVLFGWLETMRRIYLDRYGSALVAAAGTAYAEAVDVATLEWADVFRLAKMSFRSGDRRLTFPGEARLARNSLAHLEPIPFSRFAMLQTLVRELKLLVSVEVAGLYQGR